MDSPNEVQIVDELFHYLRVKLGSQIVLIILNQIHMVLPILELQMIPHDDPGFAGMLNYHGKTVPVYYLAELIKISKPQYDINSLLLISSLSEGLTGFIVSEEIDIINIKENIIQDPRINKNRNYITGLITRESWSAWILDLEKLFQFHHTNEISAHE